MKVAKSSFIGICAILFFQISFAGEIHIEVQKGNYRKVTELVKNDKDLVNSTTQEEWLKPIHLAAQYCDTRILQFLVANGSTIDPLDKNKATPLLRASLNGKSECAKVLIDAGANVNIKADENIRPLHLATMNGHFDVVKLLIQNGAEINIKDVMGGTPLNMALTNEIKTFLINHGAK